MNDRIIARLSGVTKIYKMGEYELRALDGVDLEVREGEFIAVMGHSGSGKSTLLNVLGMLDSPTGGSYTFDGANIEKYDDDQKADLRLKTLGFIFQNFNLLPRISALENVELPLIYSGVSPKERMKRALEALKAVGMESRSNHKPNELSGGQCQRVAIARALINEPKIVFADEPTGNLDTASSKDIMSILSGMNKSGKTIIMVTHESDIATYAGRRIFLKDGKIIGGGGNET